MSIKLFPIVPFDRPLLEDLMLAYFREIAPEKVVSVNGEATIDYPYLAAYWTDEKRLPFFMQRDGQTVGFALVNDWLVDRMFAANRSIAEYYVVPAFRREGVGRDAARALFAKFGGTWEVRQSAENAPAINFWRETIGRFTNGDFEEVTHSANGEIEVVQLFTT